MLIGFPPRSPEDFEDWISRLAAEFEVMVLVDVVGVPSETGRFSENLMSGRQRGGGNARVVHKGGR